MPDPAAKSLQRWLPIAALTLFAPASGGGTALWAEAVLLLGVGLIFLLDPPRQTLSVWWNLLFLGLAAIALLQYVPASWARLPEWRRTLITQYHVMLPDTRTPQPWLSWEGCGLYFGGLSWAYYLLTRRWDTPERQAAVKFYGLGVMLLAAVSIGVYVQHTKVPFWPLVRNSPVNFGFFPNRNQSANVLALGGTLMLAVAFEALNRRVKVGFLWLPFVLVIVAAVVLDYSRAGVLIFFGGAALWLAATIHLATSKKVATLCLAGVILMLAAFLLYGGDTLKRFQPEPSDSVRQWTDFRFAIQEDAVNLTAQSAVFGQGLGTFEYIFPLFREKSAAQNFAVHPESDWLWTAAEMGWLAAALFFLGVICWLPKCFPFDRNSDRRLRSAAAICGVLFVAHGFADVSGHRAGAAWPAIFFLSIALHPRRKMITSTRSVSIFRAIGVFLVSFGLWWLVTGMGDWVDRELPTSQTLQRIKARSDAALAAKDYRRMIYETSEGLKIAPLDWRLYFQRAVANAVAHNTTPAREDFARARYLVPQWADSCFIEGELWLALEKPELGWDAWRETLRRAGPSAPTFYRRMLAEQNLNAAIRRDLEDLGGTSRAYWLVFLQYSNPLECDLQIGDLLAKDPALLTLSRPERISLFRTWYEHGNRALLISSLLSYPNWLPEGWPLAAADYTRQNDYRSAFQLAMRFTEEPALPRMNESRPLAEIERNFYSHPTDLQYGITRYLAQRKLGNKAAALKTLTAMRRIPGAPPYLPYLQAVIYGEMGEWQQAWQARLEYGPLVAH